MERPREIIARGPVTLRRWRTADADKLYLAVTESLDHLRPWMPWAAEGYQLASAAEFLRQSEQDWASGDAFNYAIIVPGGEVPGDKVSAREAAGGEVAGGEVAGDKVSAREAAGGEVAGGEVAGREVPGGEVADGELAGSCGLMARIGPGGLEIGYWVHVGHIRRGLAIAAAAALAAEAFTLPGIDRVEIVHDEENVASGRIPRKLGFTEIGRRPHPPDQPGAADDVIDIVWRLRR